MTRRRSTQRDTIMTARSTDAPLSLLECRPPLLLTHHGADHMDSAIVDERDSAAGEDLAIELQLRDAFAHAAGVLDRDLVARSATPQRDFEVGPAGRDAGIEFEHVTAALDAQHGFEARPVHPG